MKATRVLILFLLLISIPSTSLGIYETIEFRDTGTNVQEMQEALKALDYLSGTADGKYGWATFEAVKRFQKANGLQTDGKAGNQTLTLLYDMVNGKKADTAIEKLVYGDKGADVKAMQASLKALGYFSGKTDGKFGWGTLQAVKAFQKANKLKVDGRAGTQTLTLLQSLSANTDSAGNATCTATKFAHTLRASHSGSDVSKVQAQLVTMNYLQVVSGTYDKDTISAVKVFQSKNNLSSDGLTGKQTYQTLFSASAITNDDTGSGESSNLPSTESTSLRSGATGEAVRSLQKRLASLDYTVSETGTYDAQTVSAVKAFQGRNGLLMDGVAGPQTQGVLYGSGALKYSANETATYPAPTLGNIKLMYWFKEVQPILKGKSSIYIYDPATGINFNLHLYSLGRHADVEPLTAQDTENMLKAFGGKTTWTPKFVYVRLPSSAWTVATMHDVPHGGQSITNNNFEGQNCVHFLRDMEETKKKDPDYGVTNQIALRKGWRALTGEVVE